MNGNAVLAGLGQGLQTFGLLKQAQIQDTAAQRKEERQFNLDKEKLDIMRQSAAAERTAAEARLEELRRQGNIASEKLDVERQKVGLMGRERMPVTDTQQILLTDESGQPILDIDGKPQYITQKTQRAVPKYGSEQPGVMEVPEGVAAEVQMGAAPPAAGGSLAPQPAPAPAEPKKSQRQLAMETGEPRYAPSGADPRVIEQQKQILTQQLEAAKRAGDQKLANEIMQKLVFM